MFCHSALPVQHTMPPSDGILQTITCIHMVEKIHKVKCGNEKKGYCRLLLGLVCQLLRSGCHVGSRTHGNLPNFTQQKARLLPETGSTDTVNRVFVTVCLCTSLTSLVMGMAEGMRGLLPSSSRVRNSILFSSSQSAYEPMSRYLHQLHTLAPRLPLEPLCISSCTRACHHALVHDSQSLRRLHPALDAAACAMHAEHCTDATALFADQGTGREVQL